MSKHESLDARLKEILMCTVCKFLPKASIFQCPQGHLICTSCFTGILQFLGEGSPEALCPQPQCGTLLSKAWTPRNVAVEKVVQELLTECRFCSQPLPRKLQDSHERELCPRRLTSCHYRVLGCVWRGPHCEAGAHEGVCPWPRKPGAELLSPLRLIDELAMQDRRKCNRVFDLLSAEAIVFHDIQLRPNGNPYPGQDCLESFSFQSFNNTWVVQARVKEQFEGPELAYQDCYSCESSTFSAFNNSWVVRVRVRVLGPSLSTIPELTYQLVLKSNNELPCEVSFCLLQGPSGDFKVNPIINRHQFSAESDASCDITVGFTDSNASYDALSTRFFNFRIFMFLSPKQE